MMMVPVSYLGAALLLLLLARDIREGEGRDRNVFLWLFLGLLIIQLVLIGTRFGYGLEWIGKIQSLTASLLGPLAYLSFARPTPRTHWTTLAIHSLPLVCAVLVSLFARQLIDISQAFFLLLYTGLLVALGMKGQDAIGWAALSRSTGVYRSLWFVVSIMILSAVTDLFVAFDFWSTGGENTAGIAGKATLIFGLLFVVATVIVGFSRRRRHQRLNKVTEHSDGAEQQVVTKITHLLKTEKLHLDPNLNLIRLARKLGVPQRQVSEAVNRQLDMSVSQFINNWRIDTVCEQLKTTQMPITQIMMNAGFNTKSNFNREFRRKMGMSPSAWRRVNEST